MLLASFILDVCSWLSTVKPTITTDSSLRIGGIQRYIEEGKYGLGKEFMSRFLRQPVFAQAHEP